MSRAAQGIARFHSTGDTAAAAAAIAADRGDAALTMVFASAAHDLKQLGSELAARGVRRVVGASTGRIISAQGFEPHGIAGFHLPSGRFATADTLLDDVAAMGLPELRARVHQLRVELSGGPGAGFEHRFALLLVDAEARCEERLAAVLGMELNGVPLIGGSAGDLYFNPLGHPPGSTRLLYHGGAARGAAILCLVASASPVIAYCHNHYMPSDKKFVITDADPARRVVREIDGRPALGVYAAACGFRRPPRESRDFAPYPLMIRIGGHYYARGMQRIYPDGALEFACALEPGLVVALAKPGDMIASLDELFTGMRRRIGAPELVIGVDCAARTAYMERQGLARGIESLLRDHCVTGFSSLGEQFNTIHANNSFTCLGVAAPA
ncbi:MAG TPA: FIST N-terminal domain-containing protein [Steroidobacteraceae bacterium]|nr:FIST N-terminal domain-containing protein [Steroidobacteraceae bacterium]